MPRELDHLPANLLLDGGMGTALIGRGLSVGTEPTESWNVTRPDDVKAVHESFIQAGSQAIQTNTFGANRIRLHAFGLSEQIGPFNAEGVKLARQVAASTGALVIGNLGPTSAVPPPEGDANLLELEYAYAEQAAALAGEGVDFLHVETLYHPKEARAALRGCRAGAPDTPVVASMTCIAVGESYRTTMGFAAESMIAAIVEEGADAIGANCTLVPADMLDLVRLMIERAQLPVFAKPTVAPDGGAPLYPEEFAMGATALFAVGARAVGGCCGTGPADIAAASAAIDSAPTSTPPASTRPYGA